MVYMVSAITGKEDCELAQQRLQQVELQVNSEEDAGLRRDGRRSGGGPCKDLGLYWKWGGKPQVGHKPTWTLHSDSTVGGVCCWERCGGAGGQRGTLGVSRGEGTVAWAKEVAVVWTDVAGS